MTYSLAITVNSFMLKLIESSWYKKSKITIILVPLSLLYCIIVFIRKLFYQVKIVKSYRLKIPVIIVGNITVGGNGKTPMVIWLANILKQSGYRPGIISRGYGGKATSWPQQVRPDSDPLIVGDEAIVISKRTQCAMAVGPDRIAAGQALIQYSKCDVIISDDGLQHYRLKRNIEVVVVDGISRFGNQLCLPAGPLREPISRLKLVDYVVTNSTTSKNEYSMYYEGEQLVSLADDKVTIELSSFKNKKIHAVAGIAKPERFFLSLQKYNIDVIEHAFIDHHLFIKEDLIFDDKLPIVMTEKDAVKCHRFNIDNCWFLPISCHVKNSLELKILNQLEN